MDRGQIEDIAMKGRDFAGYLRLLPGVVDTSAREAPDWGSMGGLSINGRSGGFNQQPSKYEIDTFGIVNTLLHTFSSWLYGQHHSPGVAVVVGWNPRTRSVFPCLRAAPSAVLSVPLVRSSVASVLLRYNPRHRPCLLRRSS